MGRLKRVLSEGFSGGRQAPVGSFGILLDEVRQQAGSRRAAARALGIAESTLRGWEKGAKPRGGVEGARLKVTTGIRRMMREKAGFGAGGQVTVTIANAGRRPAERTVAVDPGAIARAGEAWERGDLGGMVRHFRAGIADDWYREDLFKPDPDDEEWDDMDEDSQEGYDLETSEPVIGGVA